MGFQGDENALAIAQSVAFRRLTRERDRAGHITVGLLDGDHAWQAMPLQLKRFRAPLLPAFC